MKIFPFVRKQKRSPAVPSSDSYLLNELEQLSECDCFIKVKEGYIPTHAIILYKSLVCCKLLYIFTSFHCFNIKYEGDQTSI